MASSPLVTAVSDAMTAENVLGFQSDLREEVVGDFCLRLLSDSGKALLEAQRQRRRPQQRREARETQLAKHLRQCNVILDLSWEKLNTGNWKDVDFNWRLLYSHASLHKVFHLVQSSDLANDDGGIGKTASVATVTDVRYSQGDRELAVTTLKSLDMALLLGGPILGSLLTDLASKVHECIAGKDGFLAICDGEEASNSSRSPGDQATRSDAKRLKLSSSISQTEDSTPKERPSASSVSKPIPRVSEHGNMEVFIRDYFNAETPVVLSGMQDSWPAYRDDDVVVKTAADAATRSRRWNLGYLRRIAGYRTVPVEVGSKYTDESWGQRLMTIDEFIDEFFDEEDRDESDRRWKDGDSDTQRPRPRKPVGYLAQHNLFDQIPELMKDICVPDLCYVGSSEDDFVDINAWFGPKGTVSPLHFDPKHNFLAQVVGEKSVKLFDPKDSAKLYPHEGGSLLTNTSCVDVEAVNEDLFPAFKEAVCWEAILQPGETLYIPAKWWHFIKSMSISFSVSFWWQ